MFIFDFSKFKEKRQKELEEEKKLGMPSWKYRRRLIFGSYYLGIAMIVFSAATIFLDTQVGVELIVGGVALITIITTVYVGGATIEDVNLWRRWSGPKDATRRDSEDETAESEYYDG
jgi:hypothetical protein